MVVVMREEVAIMSHILVEWVQGRGCNCCNVCGYLRTKTKIYNNLTSVATYLCRVSMLEYIACC